MSLEGERHRMGSVCLNSCRFWSPFHQITDNWFMTTCARNVVDRVNEAPLNGVYGLCPIGVSDQTLYDCTTDLPFLLTAKLRPSRWNGSSFCLKRSGSSDRSASGGFSIMNLFSVWAILLSNLLKSVKSLWIYSALQWRKHQENPIDRTPQSLISDWYRMNSR